MRRWCWLTLAALSGASSLSRAQSPVAYHASVSDRVEDHLGSRVLKVNSASSGVFRNISDEAESLAVDEHSSPRAVAVEPGWADGVVRFLTNPLVAPLLISLALLGFVLEIKAGAFGIGVLLSLVSLGLFFGSSIILGLAGWPEVLLLGLGVLALAAEVFIIPGFGVAGVLGITAIVGSMVLAMISGRPTPADVAQALAVLGASLFITAAVTYAWLRHLPNSARFSGLLLKGAGHRAEGFISAPSRPELVGRSGVALTDLRPSGAARIGDERLDVVTEGEYVSQGSAVELVRSDGYRHVVRRVGSLESGASTASSDAHRTGP
jgi:membrane-bound serine protease (ClpP class)